MREFAGKCSLCEHIYETDIDAHQCPSLGYLEQRDHLIEAAAQWEEDHFLQEDEHGDWVHREL